MSRHAGYTQPLSSDFQKISHGRVLMFAIIAAVFCLLHPVAESRSRSFDRVEQGERLATANAKFALDVYHRQNAATAGNIFMSPLSISVALAMTYLGARGNTKTQMKDVMHVGEVDEAELHRTFSDIRSALSKPDQMYTLYMANRLFGEQSYEFMQVFISAGRYYYAAELASVDFRRDAAGAIDIINNWVAENTNRKITEIATRDSVDSDTRLLLVNAVYFKGEWTELFSESMTREEDFHITSTETVKVQMMHMGRTGFNHGFSDELNCQAIELPYEGDAVSMFIILPDNTVTSLSVVEGKLTADHLAKVEQKFDMEWSGVEVWLPKFKIDQQLSLKKMLTGMGMRDLFIREIADLSGIDGTNELYVSDVLHRAFVNVNENGTEAAAVTTVRMHPISFRMTRHVEEFRADHPFLFFMKYKPTGSILFLGRVNYFEAQFTPAAEAADEL